MFGINNLKQQTEDERGDEESAGKKKCTEESVRGICDRRAARGDRKVYKMVARSAVMNGDGDERRQR